MVLLAAWLLWIYTPSKRNWTSVTFWNNFIKTAVILTILSTLGTENLYVIPN